MEVQDVFIIFEIDFITILSEATIFRGGLSSYIRGNSC